MSEPLLQFKFTPYIEKNNIVQREEWEAIDILENLV